MTSLQVVKPHEGPLTANEVKAGVQLIQQVMAAVMKNGTHYGTIPGCGEKPALLKPGAEKILATFRIAADPQIEDLSQRDEIRYRVKVEGRTPNGLVVGYGVGEASTSEEKYHWKKAVCDEEWEKAPEDRRREKYGKYNGKTFTTKQIRMNPADIANCVTPEALVLTHDLQWVPAGEIESGDKLIGVEEAPNSEYARHFAIGEATVHGRRVDNIYELLFADGRLVRCNGEHQWLVKKIGLKGTEWTSTSAIYTEIVEHKGRPRKWTVMSIGKPWEDDVSKDAGYLAGLLDADGSLGVGAVIVTFAQQRNCVLASMEQGLSSRGHNFGISACKSQDELDQTIQGKQVYNLRVRGGLFEQMRLLGTLRPPRLIERWVTLIDLESRRLEGPGSGIGKPQEIVSINLIGEGEIVMLSTSCKTYIADGFVCHNTVLKMAKKRALVDLCLTATAASDIFTQDLDEMEPEVAQAIAGQDTPPPVPPPQRKSAQIAAAPAPEAQEEPGSNDGPIGAPDVVVTGIRDVREIKGKSKGGKPYTLYILDTDEGEFGSFDTDVARFAKEHLHAAVSIQWEAGVKAGSKKIVEIKEA